jgi:1-acyl-sn-glycerol-3-phosphate acyltransferase
VIVFRFLRTVLGWGVIIVMTLTFATLIGISGETEFSENVLRTWARLFLFIAGAKVTVRREEDLPKGESFVFVSNHTSNLDVPAILAVSDRPLRFIAKQELRRIPIFGWAADRMGHVFIDRKDSHGAAKAIRRRIERGLSGVGLFFFAEGTRSTTDELLPFKKGAAVAALETSLDCIPIAVAGARSVLKPKGFSLFQPGRVAVVFGKRLPVAGHTIEERTELVAEQRVAVEAALAQARSLLTPRAG